MLICGTTMKDFWARVFDTDHAATQLTIQAGVGVNFLAGMATEALLLLLLSVIVGVLNIAKTWQQLRKAKYESDTAKQELINKKNNIK